MVLSVRYSHVRNLVEHYAQEMSDDSVLSILDKGLHTEDEAKHLSYFIWKMIDEMAKDRRQGKVVLGGTDNTSMLPDVSYEMDVLMSDCGFSDIWEKISDDA
ncbi:hypothetical protein BTA51_23495 [Hahella sp. CCB-MM4]|uniref:hypothetical protein n=1 Tax=Hahella sp. (strain CCB-MM4) TaxID=1926491 RepID=UPI000B9A861C|nr:hypothetical protein [Hahella sp. CCB-MM4]OZG70810.1 hypothetical protein BTA51_23495 [Hahella sp. CCB-MM4]